jgi:hypothetical protein
LEQGGRSGVSLYLPRLAISISGWVEYYKLKAL